MPRRSCLVGLWNISPRKLDYRTLNQIANIDTLIERATKAFDKTLARLTHEGLMVAKS